MDVPRAFDEPMILVGRKRTQIADPPHPAGEGGGVACRRRFFLQASCSIFTLEIMTLVRTNFKSAHGA